MQVYQCPIHTQQKIEFICTELNCRNKVLICEVCQITFHKTHKTYRLIDYYQMIMRNQCTDADILNLKSTYKSFQTNADQLLSDFRTIITSFKKQLDVQFSSEMKLIEQQKSHQKEQMQLLKTCEETNSRSKLSKALIDLQDFLQETQQFKIFQVIKSLTNKNNQCQFNIENESLKLIKDINTYFNQFLTSLGRQQTSIIMQTPNSDQESDIRIQTVDRIQSIERIQTVEKTFVGQKAAPDHSRYKSQPKNQEIQQAYNQNLNKSSSHQIIPSYLIQMEAFDQEENQSVQSPKIIIHDIGKYQLATNQSKSNSKNQKIHSLTSIPQDFRINDPYIPLQVNIKNDSVYKEPTEKYLKLNVSSQNQSYRRNIQVRDSVQYKQNEIQQIFLRGSQYSEESDRDQKIQSPQKIEISRRTDPSFRSQISRGGSQIQTLQNRLLDSKMLSNTSSLMRLGEDNCRLYQSVQQQQVQIYNQKKNLDNNSSKSPYEKNSPMDSSPIDKLQFQEADTILVNGSLLPQVNENTECKSVTKAHTLNITSLIMFDNQIVSSSDDGSVKSISITNGVKLISVQVTELAVTCMSVFLDKTQKFMVAGCCDGSVFLFSLMNNNWKKVQTLKNDCISPVNQIIFLNQFGSNLFIFFKSGDIQIVNWLSSEKVFQQRIFQDQAGNLKPMPIYCSALQTKIVTRKTKVLMVIGGGDSTGLLSVWTGDQQLQFRNVTQFTAHNLPVIKVLFFGNYMITQAKNGDVIKMWDPQNYKLQIVIKESLPILNFSIFGPNIYISSYDRTSDRTKISRWDSNDLTKSTIITTLSGKYHQLCSNGDSLGVASTNGDILIY